MGFLDKLLGRDKSTESTSEAVIGDERRPDPGESDLGQAEERATEARDEALGTENQVPPGTS